MQNNLLVCTGRSGRTAKYQLAAPAVEQRPMMGVYFGRTRSTRPSALSLSR